MKTEIYTNCSLMRVAVKAGESKCYFPQNVAWAQEKIDKLLICAPKTACLDPIDGTTDVLTDSDLSSLSGYVSIYDTDSRELMHDVSVEQLLQRNNHPIAVNAVLNLSQCFISFATEPQQDYTLLVYVFYQTRTEDYFDMPKRSISVHFPLVANQEISFRDIINFTIHAMPEKVKGVIVWTGEDYPVYVTLRDHKLTYQMTDIHSELMRDDMNHGSAYDNQEAIFWLNDLDIDFDNSRIREAAGQSSMQELTFFY